MTYDCSAVHVLCAMNSLIRRILGSIYMVRAYSAEPLSANGLEHRYAYHLIAVAEGSEIEACTSLASATVVQRMLSSIFNHMRLLIRSVVDALTLRTYALWGCDNRVYWPLVCLNAVRRFGLDCLGSLSYWM